MNYRRLLLVLGFSLVVLPAIYRPAFAKIAPPTPAQLAKAAYVLQAKAEQSLSPTEWLFSDVKLLGRRLSEVLPNHILGWWAIQPAQTGQITVFYPPAPQNAPLLKTGETFILLADDSFHLLGVYPLGAIPEYAAQESVKDISQAFDTLVWSAQHINKMMKEFYRALETRTWSVLEGRFVGPYHPFEMTPRLLAEIKSQGGSEAYFKKIGLPEFAPFQAPFTRVILTSLTAQSAEVRLMGQNISRKTTGKPLPQTANGGWMIKLIAIRDRPYKLPTHWQIDAVIPLTE